MCSLVRRLRKYDISGKYLNSTIIRNKRDFTNNRNIIKSSLPDVEIPHTPLHEFIFENFSRFPHKIAVECSLTGKKLTFEELRLKSKNLNKALRRKLKLQNKNVIAVLLPNIPEYSICILGALEAGLIVTPLNPLYTPGELKHLLVETEANVVITLCSNYDNVREALRSLPQQIPVITIKMHQSETTPQGSINFQELIDTKYDIEDIPYNSVDDVILRLSSSGTTGLPKVAEHTHKSIVANICHINTSHLRFSEDTTENHQDTIPAVIPWFHVYGLGVILLNNLRNTSKTVSLPRFSSDLYISTLSKHKAHVLYVVPPILLLMANNPLVKREHLKSVRVICAGGSPLGPLDEEKLIQKAGTNVNVLQRYGLTEASVVLLSSPLRKLQFGLYGSVGEIVSNTSVKVVPSENHLGESFGPNQLGELLIKGPQLMKGYYKRPKETTETFVEGWMRTGDLVYYDENKMFYVTGRLKELIKVKGFQVAPAELEEIIRTYPNVSDAAVIGVPHEKFGEVPRAYVITKPNAKVDVARLEQYVSEKVISYKKPIGGIVIVDSLPKTASGKIIRRELKLQYAKEKL
ncbi:hypothetical protein ILUMI_19730 [Ignelater luminosus]|uniref:4-coumarate--CoA ligase n=1 Tax=Ignelater luminosus TaxID=2038154 RepID=A0A8K0CL47_IGNLU|nr:hypothetical protein ILUMI_19730 [Ignelater luminosus]